MRSGRSRFAILPAILALIAATAPPVGSAAASWIDDDTSPGLRTGTERPRDKVTTESTDPKPPGDGKDKPAVESKDFQATLRVPFSYVSSVVSPAGDTAINKGDFHAAPEIALRWSRQYSWVKPTVTVGVGTDLYATVREGNIDTFFTSFKLAFTDGKSDLFVPYATYVGTIYSQGFFRREDITYHEGALGFSSGIGLRGSKVIKYDEADKAGDMSINLDVRAGRRLSDISGYDNTFVQAKLDVDYVFSKTLTGEVTPKLRVRWYDDYFGDPRRDYRPGLGLRAIWKPEWLKPFASRSEIALNFDVYRNFSSLPDKTFSQWELGPTLELNAKF
jgi:hypothetical protein